MDGRRTRELLHRFVWHETPFRAPGKIEARARARLSNTPEGQFARRG